MIRDPQQRDFFTARQRDAEHRSDARWSELRADWPVGIILGVMIAVIVIGSL